MSDFLTRLWDARFAVAAVILFAVGFVTLLLHRNLIKKIIGLNIMDTAAYLLLTSLGYIENRLSPILRDGDTDPEHYVNPLPAGLVLTGIVVSVSVTAVLLALTIRLYRRYHSLNVDEIYRMAQKEHGV
jgi:multicomponent Na+:H+ antiporter subunit C